MNPLIRLGTIQEVLTIEAALPEFGAARTEATYRQRLGDAPHPILVAEVDGALAGYKVGYALNKDVFYSWLGGVLPAYRRLGLARQLMDYQEQWARQQGYHAIEVRSKNKFPAMLILLIKNGYKTSGNTLSISEICTVTPTNSIKSLALSSPVCCPTPMGRANRIF